MKDTFKKALRRGHNEGNIRQRTDGRWEVRLSAGIDYKTGNRIRHPQDKKLPPHDSTDPHNGKRACLLETAASAG